MLSAAAINNVTNKTKQRPRQALVFRQGEAAWREPLREGGRPRYLAIP